MRFSVLAVLGAVAAAYAEEAAAADVFKGEFGFPEGIAAPAPKFLPHIGPPKDAKGAKPIWHPSHKGVEIDDCDDDKADGWHWAHGSKGKKDKKPDHKWTTSTVTATQTKTVTDCPDKVPHCPGKGVKYTTVTVDVTTTICPVPIAPTAPAAPAPAPPAPSAPAPVAPAPPAPPAPGTVSKPAPAAPTKPQVAVTAAAVQNAQRAGGALAAVAAVAAALI